MKKVLIYIVSMILSVGMLNAQDFDRDAMPKAGPVPTVKIAKPEMFKLDNGLTVMVVENHKLPRVNVSLNSDRTPFYEGDIVGIGSIMSDQVGNGTTNMSKDDFNKRVDFLGARLSFGSSGAYANMLSKYFEEIMGMMADAIINPLFDAKEVEKSKERMIEGFKADEKSAKAIAGNVFPALTYGKNTALGEFATAKNIERITTEDVKQYFKRYYSPENYYLVVVGDVTVDQVKKVLENGLEKWERTPNNSFPPLAKQQNLEQTEINIVNVTNAVQSVLKVGNLHNLKRSDKDYFAATIANYVLGGGSLESRLNMNLREKNAFTYGAYSSLSSSKYSPKFSASTNVRNEVTADAVKELMKEMKNISAITDEELKNAKSQLKGSFIMSLEQPSTIANFALSQIVNNLPNDFYANYLASIDAVTKEDVKAAAEKYILPGKARIFIAGKATDFADDLEKLGYKITYYDRDAMPTAKPEKKQVAKDVTVASIAEKYIEAIGGKAAVEKLTSVKMVATAKLQGMELKTISIAANGAKSMVDVSMMGNSVNKMVFDGTEGYIQAQGQKVPMPDALKAEMAKNTKVFPELAFGKELTLKGIENIKGEDAYAVINGKTTLYYSVATGLKIAEIKKDKAPTGQEVVVPSYYSDYKEVDGVKVPHTITQEMQGMEIVSKVDSYEFNTAKEEDFK